LLVFYEIEVSAIDTSEDRNDEMEMLIEQYPSASNHILLYSMKDRNAVLNIIPLTNVTSHLKVNTAFFNSTLKIEFYEFYTVMKGEDNYIIQKVDGTLVANKIHYRVSLGTNGKSVFRALSQSNFAVIKNTNQVFNFEKGYLSNEPSFSGLKSYLLKIESDVVLIFNLLKELFLSSPYISKRKLLSHSTKDCKKLCEMEMLKAIRAEINKKKIYSKKGTLYSLFLSDALISLDRHIINAVPAQGIPTNNALFNAYRSMSNVLFNLAEYKNNEGLKSLSFITSFRCLEMYLSGYLLHCGKLNIINYYGVWKLDNPNSGKSMNGFGRIWEVAKTLSVISQKTQCTKNIDSYIGVRNSHLYGHGFNLNNESFSNEVSSEILDLISYLDNAIPSQQSSWKGLTTISDDFFNFSISESILKTMSNFLGVEIEPF
jgi:hypothetical protein